MAKDDKPTKAELAMVPDEDADAVLKGLEREKAGYEDRLGLVKSGRRTPTAENLSEEELTARLKAVNAEIARVKREGVTNREKAALKDREERKEAEAEEA